MKMKIACLAVASTIAAAAAIADAQASGFATFFAALNVNGVVVVSSGVSGSTKIGAGKYEVTFTRDVAGCATFVNITGITPGYGINRKKPGTTDTLQVFTYSSAGALTDYNFNVLVLCNS